MGDAAPESKTTAPTREEPVTHKQLLQWVMAGGVALLAAALLFGTNIISRAEAATTAILGPVQQRLERIEAKVDQLLLRGDR